MNWGSFFFKNLYKNLRLDFFMLIIKKNDFIGRWWRPEWLFCIAVGSEFIADAFEPETGLVQVDFIHVYFYLKQKFISKSSKMVILSWNCIFCLEKYRNKNGKKPPVIQQQKLKAEKINLFIPLMKKWLINEAFCKKFLESKPASLVEAFHSLWLGLFTLINTF